MTRKERVVEDMDTDTVFGLKSRGYRHGYIYQKEDCGNRKFLVIERGSSRLDEKKCARNFASLLLGIGIDIDLAIGRFLKIQHEPNLSVNTWHYFGDF